MERKIVQIACSESSVSLKFEDRARENLYALCNDGTLWFIYQDGNRDRGWLQVDPIPQPSPEEEKSAQAYHEELKRIVNAEPHDVGDQYLEHMEAWLKS